VTSPQPPKTPWQPMSAPRIIFSSKFLAVRSQLNARAGRRTTCIAMKLPSDYLDVVARGATTLNGLGARLRRMAAGHSDVPELWLSVRDYESLGQRLAEFSEWEWQHGTADVMITSVDFAVLDELLAPGPLPISLSGEENSAIARLRNFLHRYCRREFELDDPAA